jgi:hypothetical protein
VNFRKPLGEKRQTNSSNRVMHESSVPARTLRSLGRDRTELGSPLKANLIGAKNRANLRRRKPKTCSSEADPVRAWQRPVSNWTGMGPRELTSTRRGGRDEADSGLGYHFITMMERRAPGHRDYRHRRPLDGEGIVRGREIECSAIIVDQARAASG